MDTEKDLPEPEDPNWAFPLLRIVLVGPLIEITCTTIMVVFSRAGFVPEALEPFVDYSIMGTVIAGFWVTCSFRLYLWVRPGLNGDPRS